MSNPNNLRRSGSALAILLVYGIWYATGLGKFGTADDVWESLLYDVVTTLLLPVSCLIFLYKVTGLSPRDYWIVSPFSQRGASEVVALTFLSTLLLLTYVLVANIAAPSDALADNRYGHRSDVSTNASLLIMVYRSAAAAFSEEVFYRALPRFVLATGNSSIRTIAYVFVSSSIFGLMHAPYGMPSIISAGYFAVVAALILIWTNNLWYLFAGHFITDTIILWWRYAKYGVLSV
jgi:membrane protease YdiL (CAAX protease family)